MKWIFVLMEFTFINDRLKQDLFESQAMKQENRMQYFHWNIYVQYTDSERCTLHTAHSIRGRKSIFMQKRSQRLYAPVFGQSKTAICDSYQQLINVLDKSRTGTDWLNRMAAQT